MSEISEALEAWRQAVRDLDATMPSTADWLRARMIEEDRRAAYQALATDSSASDPRFGLERGPLRPIVSGASPTSWDDPPTPFDSNQRLGAYPSGPLIHDPCPSGVPVGRATFEAILGSFRLPRSGRSASVSQASHHASALSWGIA
jgi:hypothetical protein